MWFARDGMAMGAIEELQTGSDRTVAIVAGAVVESCLEDAIRIDLCRDKSKRGLEVQTTAFSPDGVLGTFGAKISLAYLLGYLSEDAYLDLLNLKYLRNKFAHYSDNWSFDIQYIRDRCTNFRLVNSRIKPHNAMIRDDKIGGMIPAESAAYVHGEGIFLHMPDHEKELASARGRFLATAKLFNIAFSPIVRVTPEIAKPAI